MKKIFRNTVFSAILVIALASVLKLDTFAAITPMDIKTPESLNSISNDAICITDFSWSMQNTFEYESKMIGKNLSKIVFNEKHLFGNNGQTYLWKSINKYINTYKTIVVTSDLWDTSHEELQNASDKVLYAVVPYYSTNSEGVEHVNDIVNNIILEKWDNSSVHIIYLDGLQTTFSNIIENVGIEKKTDDILSDEDAAIDTATSIKESIEEDKTIQRDSIVVFDISGSMYSFMELVYSQLKEMTTTENIEAMYALATRVSDKINPKDFNEELWEELKYSLGGTSNIIGGINKASTEYPNSHIYLISDLQNTMNSWYTDNEFSGIITVFQYDDEDTILHYSDQFFEDISKYYPNAECIERISAN